MDENGIKLKLRVCTLTPPSKQLGARKDVDLNSQLGIPTREIGPLSRAPTFRPEDH